MIASTIVIGLIISFWCYFSSQSAPGLTALRPHGIALLLAIGAVILLAPQTPYIGYLIAAEAAIASLVFIATVGCVIALAVGDYPTKNHARAGWTVMVTLLAVTGWTAYFLGGMPGLYGAGIALAIIVGGYLIALIRQR